MGHVYNDILGCIHLYLICHCAWCFVGGEFPVHACVYWISFIHRHEAFRYSIIYTKFLHCILIGIHHVKLNVTIYTGIDTMISLHEFLLLLIVIVNWRWILLLLLLLLDVYIDNPRLLSKKKLFTGKSNFISSQNLKNN